MFWSFSIFTDVSLTPVANISKDAASFLPGLYFLNSIRNNNLYRHWWLFTRLQIANKFIIIKFIRSSKTADVVR